LYSLGLSERIIGVTRFCTAPKNKPAFVQKTGGTKTLNLQKIIDLKPNIIIANKEENDPDQIFFLKEHFPCYVSDIKTLSDNERLIKDMGLLFNREQEALSLNMNIKSRKNEFNKQNHVELSAVYFIWNKPLMVAGNDCFIDHMMGEFGFRNMIKKPRYPEIIADELSEMEPDIILLSDEPYPFKERHVESFKKLAPKSRVILVDGSIFSWYGSRLTRAFEYGKKIREKINSLDAEDK
jgi:ABC-type Fe3+-hydroxamate transport system substrate-binding protein